MKVAWGVLFGTAALSALGQVAGPPPMKMGLWETTSQIKMSGVDLPPAVEKMMAGSPTVTRSCFTPESWRKAFSQSREQKDCTRTNELITPGKYSVDLSCNTGKTSAHINMVFESMEKGHGTVTMTIDPGNGHTMHTDVTTTTTYLGADCGTVTPEKPQFVTSGR